MSLQDLEPRVAFFNENIFFREFSYAQTTFTPSAGSEVELTDHLVWLDDLLLSFQLKQRMVKETTAQAEEKWFRTKVVSKAKQQIKDTHRYLNAHAPIQVTNARGHQFGIEPSRIKRWHDVILYDSHPLLPSNLDNSKSVVSSEVGLIHIFHVKDYQRVSQILFTPAEIADYLDYRRELLLQSSQEVMLLSEDCLLGHYLYGDLLSLPQPESAKWVENLDKESLSFDLTSMLHQFAEKIVPGEPWGFSAASSTDYYRILQELARLNRSELRWFKERRDLVMQWCQADEFELPTRMVSPRTGCGFVLISIPSDAKAHLGIALQNFTDAHKYDQHLTKCIGVAFSKDGSYWDIGWCLVEEEWVYDSQMEQKLKLNFPFRPVRHQQTTTYRFLTDI